MKMVMFLIRHGKVNHIKVLLLYFVKTLLNVINKIKNKEDLKASELKKIEALKESLRNTITILQVATKNTENLFSTLDKTT